MVIHFEFSLAPKPRGYHLITSEILKNIELPLNGILNLFIKHTSAGLTINENADSDVRVDFESIFNQLIPENLPFLQHTMEGPDDMPAHIKSSLVGSSLTVPIIDGKLALGTWQGVYLCEHRNQGGRRHLVITAFGK